MAAALGQDPEGVFLAPYDHAGINDAVGDLDDPAGETEAIMAFMRDAIAAAQPPRAKLRKRPPKRIETVRRRAKLRFRFTSPDPGASFECRLDAAAFRPCQSPRRIVVGRGKHRFGVRAVAANGRLGTPASPAPEAVDAFLAERGVRYTTWDGWYRLDAAEKALGEPQGRERVKIVEREDMLRESGA